MKTKTGLPAKFFRIKVWENKTLVHQYDMTNFIYFCDYAINILPMANESGDVRVQYFHCGASTTETLLWETRVNSGDLLKLKLSR